MRVTLIILAIILAPFVYGLIVSAIFGRFYAFGSAFVISLSQALNCFYAEFFNHFLLKKKGPYLFGDPNETTSYVLGKNKEVRNLSFLGLWLSAFLHWIDPNHVEDATENPQ